MATRNRSPEGFGTPRWGNLKWTQADAESSPVYLFMKALTHQTKGETARVDECLARLEGLGCFVVFYPPPRPDAGQVATLAKGGRP